MAQRTEPFVGGTSKKSINSAAKASAATESFTEKLSDIDFKAVAGRVFESVSAISEDFTKSKDALQKQAREYAKMAIEYGQTTADGRFTLLPICCLGNCDKGPTLMIDNDTHGPVTVADVPALLERYV